MAKKKKAPWEGEYSGVAAQAIRDIFKTLGNEYHSFYEDVEIKTQNDPNAGGKMLFGIKVLVSRSNRNKAADQIREDLVDGNFDWNVAYPGQADGLIITRNGYQIDCAVQLGTDIIKTIRIEVKPEAGKGSGGGADETAYNESAQCLYASIAFNVLRSELSENVSDYDDPMYEKASKYIDVDVDWKELKPGEQIGVEWRNSSVRGANELWKRFGTGSSAGEYCFFRGGGPDDAEIKQAYLRCKKGTIFNSEDKWNPADIWMARKTELPRLKTGLNDCANMESLNNFIEKEYCRKNMMGISLKKITNATPSWSVKNLSANAERKATEMESYGFKSYDLIFDNKSKKSPYPIDVYVYFGDGAKQNFQARNFGGNTTASWQLELSGVSANQGRIGGGVVVKVIQSLASVKDYKLNTNTPLLQNIDNQTVWSKSDPDNESSRKKFTDDLYDLLDEHKQTIKTTRNNKSGTMNLIAQKCTADDTKLTIGQQNQSYRYSKMFGMHLLSCLKAQPDGGDRIMRELYAYASSQSDISGVYAKME